MSDKFALFLLGAALVGTALTDMAWRNDWDVLSFLLYRAEVLASLAVLFVVLFEFGSIFVDFGKAAWRRFLGSK